MNLKTFIGIMPSTNTTRYIDTLRNQSGSEINLAVIGHPVEHSLSPKMHNAALSMCAVSKSELQRWAYGKFDIVPEQLAEALPLFHKRGFLGLNLTVPHKVDVLEQKLAVPESEQVVKIGAANTLKWRPDGYVAYNTDAYGMSRAIAEAFFEGISEPLKGRSIVLLGAGGAARAAAFQCVEEGCSELIIINRNAERLSSLIRDLDAACVRGLLPSEVDDFKFSEHPLLINATSLGLKSSDALPFAFEGRSEQWRLFDMIYNPAETPLMAAAKAAGFEVANGLQMLVWQGALALALWMEDSLEAAQVRAQELAPEMRRALQT